MDLTDGAVQRREAREAEIRRRADRWQSWRGMDHLPRARLPGVHDDGGKPVMVGPADNEEHLYELIRGWEFLHLEDEWAMEPEGGSAVAGQEDSDVKKQPGKAQDPAEGVLLARVEKLERVTAAQRREIAVLRQQQEAQDVRHAQEVDEFRLEANRMTAMIRRATATRSGGELVELRPRDGGETE